MIMKTTTPADRIPRIRLSDMWFSYLVYYLSPVYNESKLFYMEHLENWVVLTYIN